MRSDTDMENKITREIVIDGTFFNNFEEFYNLLSLLLIDRQAEENEASLENMTALMETQKDYYILLAWENADLSRITFGHDALVSYCSARGETAEADQTLYDKITEILTRKDLGYQCELNAVDGLRMAEYSFDPKSLSDTYDVSVITEDDIPEVLALYMENPEYMKLRGIEAAPDAIRSEMNKCPDGCAKENKYYVIFRDPDVIAAADIYLHYPRQDAIYIDLIMISKELQGFSYGSEILRDILDAFAACGFMWAEAGFLKGNVSAEKFFRRNWFVDLHSETKEEDGSVWHHMIRGLQ